MKEPASDIKFWQDKMLQLPLEGDEQDMWQNMQSLLDENMPVDPSGSGPASPKNSPGAGTIISVIVIITAIVLLLLHFMGVFQPAKQHKIENNINKVQADRVTASTNNPNTTIGKQNDAEGKNPTTDSITASKNSSNDETSKNDVGRRKGASPTGKNSSVNGTGSANTTASGGSHNNKLKDNLADGKKSRSTQSADNKANARANNAGRATKPKGHVNSKRLGAGKPGDNNGYSSTNNSGRHRINHSMVSGIQASSDAYLRANAAKNKTGHYSRRKNASSGNQQKLAKNNGGSGVNYPAPNVNQQGGKNNTDSTSPAKPKTQDTISSLVTTNQQAVHNKLLSPNKTDSTSMAPALTPATNNAANKQTAQSNAVDKNKAAKDGKSSNKYAKKQPGNSKFELDLRLGLNAGSGSSTYPGINAGYYFTPKLGVLIGTDVMPSRTLSGSYIKSNLEYTVDTGKLGKRQTGKIIISGSRKFYTIDVPVTATYRINKLITVYGGPVISLPVKANAIKNSLTLPANATDTARNAVAPYVSSTIINNKLNFGLSAGARLNFNRWFISAGYMQDAQTYTISSALGSGKIGRHHAAQFGIGFQLFKSKKTKP